MNPIPSTLEEADAILTSVCGGAPELGFALPGWCTPDKAKRLMRIAKWRAPEIAVEVGVHGGRSLVALAMGVKFAGLGHIDGIDSYSAVDCLEGEQSDVDKQLWSATEYETLHTSALSGLTLHDLNDAARIVRKRADDAVHDYADGSIDLIHLDGNHSELVSCRDVATWLPKMRSISTWICDDTNWASMKKALGMLEASGFKPVEQGSEGYWTVYAR